MKPKPESKPTTARDPRARFRELATKRTTNALRDLRLLGNLANRRTYEWDQADARKILKAIKAEVKALEARFSNAEGGEPGNIFSL